MFDVYNDNSIKTGKREDREATGLAHGNIYQLVRRYNSGRDCQELKIDIYPEKPGSELTTSQEEVDTHIASRQTCFQ